MREIKFRGKRKDNGKWVYGDLLHPSNGKVFIWEGVVWNDWVDDVVEVIPETIGQYTGLKDKNGKEIYEGDILSIDGYNENDFYNKPSLGVVRFNEGCFQLYTVTEFIDNLIVLKSSIIIGNIYENPEMLEE